MELNWRLKVSELEYWRVLEVSVSRSQLTPASLDEPKLFPWIIKYFMDERSDLLQD